MRLFNTLTRKKEDFVPIKQGKVMMYSCGPTVYNYFHIGNARPFIVFDTLRKYFIYKGHDVDFVQNFTDIDDKMIKKANEEGITVKELADKFIAEYYVDAKGLGVDAPTYSPKATENISEIIELIEKLENRGIAYSIDGDVYFSTKKFSEYGKLSHQTIEDLEIGARISVDERKKEAGDFALWKAHKDGEPYWESKWGNGRPGWHIECSAMANKYLGETIDIHSGGQDLIFPHHENEIAQSEAANDKPFANYWLHNGFININNQKMSKSKGNFFTVRDIAKHFDYEVIRFFMLSSHYRSQINFSYELLEQSKSGLDRIYNCLYNLNYLKKHLIAKEFSQEERGFVKTLEVLKEKFIESMDDDLNTAGAIASIFDIVRDVNQYTAANNNVSVQMIDFITALIKELGGILGIAQKQNEEVLEHEVKELISKREQARKEKNFKIADEIRDKLKEMGIVLEDTTQGVNWKKV